MLSAEELRAVFDGFTYRPGWQFVVVDDRWEGLSTSPSAPTSTTPTGLAKRSRSTSCRRSRRSDDEQQVKDWLAWRLQRIEVHESREWLRYRGERVNSPHDGVERT